MAGPYYVRKTGLDSNDGLSAGNAFLTIDKAANTVVSNTDVWVGAGVYREQVVMDTAGTSGNQIRFMADIDGTKTGDAGLVIISAYDDEVSAATRTSCVNPNDKGFITWDGFIFTGGTLGCFYDGAGATAYEGTTWNDCTFIAGHDDADNSLRIDFGDAATPTANGPQFTGCVFTGAVRLLWELNATADRDRKVNFDNCLWTGGQNSGPGVTGLYIDQEAGSGSFGATGFTVTNSTFYSTYSSVYADSNTVTGAITIKNCLFHSCRNGLNDQDSTNKDAITSDYNTFTIVQTPYTNTTQGANDRSVSTDPGLLGGLADLILYKRLGWSPFKPWEPIRLQDDTYTHAVIGDADSSVAPATDLYGNPRPMHGTVDDRGAVEGRARPIQDTTSKISTGSTNSARFDGAGYHDFFVPVAAQSTTITIDAEYDSNYTGTKPSMTVTNDAIMTEVTDTMTAAANTEETLTSGAFTPSAAGVVKVRVTSSDTSATGKCWFDVLTVT